jgi:hypothetical protein
MCFYSTTKRFKIADRDITCYKVLSIPESYFVGINEVLKTPYTNTAVPKDIWSGKSPFLAHGIFDAEKIESGIFKGLYMITSGVIHTFMYRFGAKKYLGEDSVLFECIIPKGTRYIEGDDGYNSCYVSEKIKFLKKS